MQVKKLSPYLLVFLYKISMFLRRNILTIFRKIQPGFSLIGRPHRI